MIEILLFFFFSSLTENDDLILIPTEDNELSSPVKFNNIKDLLDSNMRHTHRRV